MRLLIALMLGIFSTAPAQQPPDLTGKWSVDAAAAESQSGSERWVLTAVNGTLTLEQKDSRITGTWKGVAPEPWKLTGTFKDNRFELETESREIATLRNGEKRMVTRRWQFRGSISNDQLSGWMYLRDGDDVDPPSQSFSATRTR